MAILRGMKHIVQDKIAKIQQHLIVMVVSLIMQLMPWNPRGKRFRNIVKKWEQSSQFDFSCERNIFVSKQHFQCGLQDLIIEIIRGKLIEGTGGLRLALDADPNRLRKIQLSAQNGQGFASGDIVSMKSLLQLTGNAFGKDRSK